LNVLLTHQLYSLGSNKEPCTKLIYTLVSLYSISSIMKHSSSGNTHLSSKTSHDNHSACGSAQQFPSSRHPESPKLMNTLRSLVLKYTGSLYRAGSSSSSCIPSRSATMCRCHSRPRVEKAINFACERTSSRSSLLRLASGLCSDSSQRQCRKMRTPPLSAR